MKQRKKDPLTLGLQGTQYGIICSHLIKGVQYHVVLAREGLNNADRKCRIFKNNTLVKESVDKDLTMDSMTAWEKLKEYMNERS